MLKFVSIRMWISTYKSMQIWRWIQFSAYMYTVRLEYYITAYMYEKLINCGLLRTSFRSKMATFMPHIMCFVKVALLCTHLDHRIQIQWELVMWQSCSKFAFVECEFQLPKFVEFEFECDCCFISVYFITAVRMQRSWFMSVNDCDNMLFLNVSKIIFQVSTA